MPISTSCHYRWHTNCAKYRKAQDCGCECHKSKVEK
jgi:hypothetical protein